MATPEQAVVNAALHYLQWKGVFAWRNNTGGMRWTDNTNRQHVMKFGYRGSADILGILPDGRFLACEAKYGKGKLSSYQSAFLEEVRRRGGVAIVVYEHNWQEVIDAAVVLAERRQEEIE